MQIVVKRENDTKTFEIKDTSSIYGIYFFNALLSVVVIFLIARLFKYTLEIPLIITLIFSLIAIWNLYEIAKLNKQLKYDIELDIPHRVIKRGGRVIKMEGYKAYYKLSNVGSGRSFHAQTAEVFFTNDKITIRFLTTIKEFIRLNNFLKDYAQLELSQR